MNIACDVAFQLGPYQTELLADLCHFTLVMDNPVLVFGKKAGGDRDRKRNDTCNNARPREQMT